MGGMSHFLSQRRFTNVDVKSVSYRTNISRSESVLGNDTMVWSRDPNIPTFYFRGSKVGRTFPTQTYFVAYLRIFTPD